MGFFERLANFFLDFDNKEPFNAAQDFTVLVVGLVLVIVALFLLSLLISLFPHIFKERKGKENKKEDKKDAKPDVSNTENVIVPSVKEDIKDEGELIAVLTAAVMASYGSQTNCNLKVTSFRRVNNTSPAWNTAGKQDNLNASL